MTHIPYSGTSASMADLAADQITLAVGALTAITPLVEAGKVKVLATTAGEREVWRFDIRLQGDGETVFFDI